MKALSGLLLLVVCTVATQAGDEKDKKDADIDKEKLVGTWEATKTSKGAWEVGTTLEFSKDGKMEIRIKDVAPLDGTYTVTASKITFVRKQGDKERRFPLVIKKLTATELTLTDEKETKPIEFKRKK